MDKIPPVREAFRPPFSKGVITVLINGANGKMGSTAVSAIAHEKDLRLIGKTSRQDNLLDAIKQYSPDIVIDFTEPACAFKNTKIIIDAGARPVIGTTGFSEKEIIELTDICKTKKRGAIIAPNFSIGAILMMRYAQDAAKYFSNVDIIEYHHPTKKDAPSGTAKKTAELIQASGIRDQGLIPIHSVRLPGIFAEQQVIFGGAGETLMLQHRAIDRNAMMPGLFLCCRKVMELDHLVYGIESLI